MIVPWCVDVPQERRPVINWLIVAASIAVFALQISEFARTASDPAAAASRNAVRGITDVMMLNGWSLTGLFGHIWIHGDLMHLLGNMWFLWIFGNAVCAKVGNLRYLVLYVLLGTTAGVTHLLFDSRPALGASGAINGVVGMYLVLFYENRITCYWTPILIYWRQFTIGSFWMIGFWLFWDIVGATRADSSVAYFAHLGGFGAGFVAALYMCKKNWIVMERYEKSLWQWWQQRRAGRSRMSPGSVAPSLHDDTRQERSRHEPTAPPQTAGPTVLGRDSAPGPACPSTTPARSSENEIRFACTCGKRIRVPARFAGRHGKCPGCGDRVRVPRPS